MSYLERRTKSSISKNGRVSCGLAHQPNINASANILISSSDFPRNGNRYKEVREIPRNRNRYQQVIGRWACLQLAKATKYLLVYYLRKYTCVERYPVDVCILHTMTAYFVTVPSYPPDPSLKILVMADVVHHRHLHQSVTTTTTDQNQVRQANRSVSANNTLFFLFALA